MSPVLSRLNKMVTKPRSKLEEKSVKPLPALSRDAENLLIHVNEHPFTSLSSRYRTLAFSGRKAETVKKELIDKGLVEEVEVVLGRYRPVKFLVLTSQGIKYLKHIEQETGLWDYIGHLSFEHRLYQVLIAYSFRNAGHQAFIEKDFGDGRRLDVLIIHDKKKIGVEVELNPNIDLRKILKTLRELDKLLIVCKDKTVMNKVRETVERVAYPSLRKKITFHVANEYLASLGDMNGCRDGNKSIYKKRIVPAFNLGKKLGNKEKN